MRLSATEKRMLGGEKGPACELAMNILNDLGSLFGAGRMIPITQVHIDANRKAERLIELKGVPDDVFEDSKIFPVLGFVFGEIAGDRVAALKGMPERIARDDLKAFSAAAASSGAVGLFHIIGVTPEAPDEKTCLKGDPRGMASVITPGIINARTEPLLATGPIVGKHFYGNSFPIVNVAAVDFAAILTGWYAEIESQKNRTRILISDPKNRQP